MTTYLSRGGENPSTLPEPSGWADPSRSPARHGAAQGRNLTSLITQHKEVPLASEADRPVLDRHDVGRSCR